MYSSEELKKEISKTALKVEESQNNLDYLINYFRESATFNSIQISGILAELATIIEGEKFVSVNVKAYYTQPILSNYYVFVSGIVKANKENTCKTVKDIYSMSVYDYFGVGSCRIDCDDKFRDLWDNVTGGFDITFRCLWRRLDKSKSTILQNFLFDSNDNFMDSVTPKYMIRFIEYLFDLRVQRNGKQLTYEEMQKAMNDFLKLEKNKQNKRLKKKIISKIR